MALHDEILREIVAGRVPRRFKIRDLKTISGSRPRHYRVGNSEYAENAINTIPRNHSARPDGTNPGDYVGKGRKPAFWWYGKGEYELALDHRHSFEDSNSEDEEFDGTEGEKDELIHSASGKAARSPLKVSVDNALVLRICKKHQDSDPAEIVVRYIAEMPFQRYRRRRPVGSQQRGWGRRLAAYSWREDWQTTCDRLSGLSSRIKQAIARLEQQSGNAAAAEELLNAFKDTCVWGSVRLPESDPAILAAEVLAAWRSLSQEQTPSTDCRLNSAWTKLYALALPDKCIIYDSRVAAALTSILDPAMRFLSGRRSWPYANIGTVPGRGGSRPRALRWHWPNGYSRWASQLAANRLCGSVLTVLNHQAETRPDCQKRDGSGPWSLREVEAVLFMEGY